MSNSNALALNPSEAVSQPQIRDGEGTVKSQKTSEAFEMEAAMDEQPSDRDDFQQIKGIGPSFASTLNDCGIHTFEHLAEFTPESLASLLKSRIPRISPQRIEANDWIGQARALAASGEGAGLVEPENESEIDADQPDGDAEITSLETWRELADFFVSYGYAIGPQGEENLQTKVHHSQEDRYQSWEGISTHDLVRWMLEQADLPHPPEDEPAGEEAAGREETPPESESIQTAQLTIEDLWVTESQAAVVVDEGESKAFLRAEARLVLSGPGALDLTRDQNPFNIDIYLVDTVDRHSELIASTRDRLTPGVLDYHIKTSFIVPPVGRYQLYLLASLLPPAALVAQLQGPIIRVKPQSGEGGGKTTGFYSGRNA